MAVTAETVSPDPNIAPTMDLTFLEPDTSNTVLFQPNGMPLYHIDTPVRIFKRPVTIIKKFSGSTEAVMATIYTRGWNESVVESWGRNITPYRGGLLTTSERFQASDGRSYKWRVDGRDFTLYTDDGTSTPVATFDSGPMGLMGLFSTPRPPRLAVAPQGMPILDDIVATFVHMDRRRRERSRRRRRQNASLAMSR